MQVMIELVVNHTSDQHPWFQRARQAPPGSPERDFYVWSDTDQKYQRRAHHLHRHRKIELDVGPGRQGILLAPLFLAPAGSELRQSAGASRKCSRSCVSGWIWESTRLRLDAIPYLVERDGTNCENLPETHALIKTLRAR